MKYQKILSIYGGGIRGVIPARILKEIESRTGERIYELFDLIVGTSTGGILAAGLTTPKSKDGNGPHTAEAMLSFYTEHGREIFNRSLWQGITSIGGLSDEKYDAAPLEGLLCDKLGDAELKDTVRDIVVTSYDIEKRKPYFFKTSRAREKPGERNHLLRHVARATSAAPTYFEAFLLDNSRWTGESERRVLVDGGVFANNPSMVALSEALSSGAQREDILLCALGTGHNNRKIPYEEAKDWGMISWARPVISVMMDGMSDSADYHMRGLLPDEKAGELQRYFRFDIKLENALDDMDAAHRSNINNLLTKADQIMEKQEAELSSLIDLLTQS